VQRLEHAGGNGGGFGSSAARRFQPLATSAVVRKLSEIEAADVPRFSTGIDEFDRVLGGGLVAGGWC
jgi:DNA repair protein RadA/Sms